MAYPSKWPENLSDGEAVTRLQSIMIAACEGARDLSIDRDYKRFRGELIKRPDLSDVVPKFLRSHRDLTSFWSYIRKVSEKWQPRRDHVWKEFEPLFDRVEGRSRPPVISSKWTGRRTAAQQAQIVMSLAPSAMVAVEMLLDEQERSLHNGGPVDPEQNQAIELLRQLHFALGELIELAGKSQPLTSKLETLRNLKRSAFNWSTSSYGLALGELPLTASSTAIGCGIMFLVNALTKSLPEAAAMGAAATGVYGAAAIKSRQNENKTTA